MSVIREFLPHPLRLLLRFSWLQKSNFLYPCTVFFWPRRWAKSEENTPRKQQFHWLGWPTTFKNHLFLEKKFLPLQYQPNIFNLHFSILQNKRWNFFFIPLTPGALYTGRLRPEDQPLTVLYTIFAAKDTRFVYLLSLLTHSTPFTYLL